MPTRLWSDLDARQGVLILTDAQALEMLERGRRIRPVEGAAKVIDSISSEIAADRDMVSV